MHRLVGGACNLFRFAVSGYENPRSPFSDRSQRFRHRTEKIVFIKLLTYLTFSSTLTVIGGL